MRRNNFPLGWNEERVQKVLAHYEEQTEDEAIAEDEAIEAEQAQTLMEIPSELVPAVRALLAEYYGDETVAEQKG